MLPILPILEASASDVIWQIIITAVAALIVLVILLKICGRFPFINYLFIIGSAIALCVVCFSVKPAASSSSDRFNGVAAIWEAVLVAMYVMFTWADIAFDTYEYYEHTAEYNSWSDTVTVTLSLANSEAVTAMQTFIPLGDNLTYVPGSATLTSRSNGHQLTASVLEGSLRLCWEGGALTLEKGKTCFLPASCPALTLEGTGTAAVSMPR